MLDEEKRWVAWSKTVDARTSSLRCACGWASGGRRFLRLGPGSISQLCSEKRVSRVALRAGARAGEVANEQA